MPQLHFNSPLLSSRGQGSAPQSAVLMGHSKAAERQFKPRVLCCITPPFSPAILCSPPSRSSFPPHRPPPTRGRHTGAPHSLVLCTPVRPSAPVPCASSCRVGVLSFPGDGCGWNMLCGLWSSRFAGERDSNNRPFRSSTPNDKWQLATLVAAQPTTTVCIATGTASRGEQWQRGHNTNHTTGDGRRRGAWERAS